MGLESLPTVERIEQPNNQLSNAQSLQEIHILISPNLGFYVAVRRATTNSFTLASPAQITLTHKVPSSFLAGVLEIFV